MGNPIEAIENASAETQEILKELEAEGHTIEGNPEAKEPEPKPEPKKEPAKEPEPKPEEKKPETATDPEKKEPENKAPNRASKFVPVDKYNDERHKRQDAEAKATAAEAKAKELEAKLNGTADKPKEGESDDVKTVAIELAQKHGVDEEFAKDFAEKIVAIASKRTVLPQDIAEQLAKFSKATAEAETAKLEAAQESGFSKEFDELVKTFEADQSKSSYLAEMKEEIKQLAFSQGNEHIPLRKIVLEYLHDNPPPTNKRSAEAPIKVSRDANEVIDFSEMTDDQLKALDGERLDQYIAYLDKKNK